MIRSKKKAFLFSMSIIVVLTIAYLASTNINEIGLNILTKVKELGGNSVKLENINVSKSSRISHEIWDKLVRKHVTIDGRVNYEGIQADSTLLTSYLELLSNNAPSVKWSKESKLAYWINAYNAFTVQLILNHYPLYSIKDISSGLPMINSPWDIKFFKIGGIDFDLNTIEHEILRKKFQEPRIHFVINCASISCPRLRNEAFTADKLEEQLLEQTIEFFANSDKNMISQTESKISSIMNWFESDFTKDQPLKEFISTYNQNFNTDIQINYMDYDWSLNK